MNSKNIIAKLKKSNLTGRGGSGFPTGLKWEAVKKEKAKKKYIVCNASEGEPNVFKDGFVLENYPKEVIEGTKIALETIDNSSAFIYLRKDYYQKFKKKLEKLAKGLPITLFKKTGGYLAGEETTLLNAIEGKRLEPRLKPPFPFQRGLFGFPTLINNVETFYWVAKIAKGEYKGNRFYSISGDTRNKGVYELPENWTIEKILKESNNYPKFNSSTPLRSSFFVQSGGGSSGEILLAGELNQKVRGQGAIVIFDRKKTNLFSLMKKWADFFLKENCDKCVPCREGVYRIAEMVKKEKNHPVKLSTRGKHLAERRLNRIDKKTLKDLFFVLEETSFCPLGKSVAVPFRSLIEKLL